MSKRIILSSVLTGCVAVVVHLLLCTPFFLAFFLRDLRYIRAVTPGYDGILALIWTSLEGVSLLIVGLFFSSGLYGRLPHFLRGDVAIPLLTAPYWFLCGFIVSYIVRRARVKLVSRMEETTMAKEANLTERTGWQFHVCVVLAIAALTVGPGFVCSYAGFYPRYLQEKESETTFSKFDKEKIQWGAWEPIKKAESSFAGDRLRDENYIEFRVGRYDTFLHSFELFQGRERPDSSVTGYLTIATDSHVRIPRLIALIVGIVLFFFAALAGAIIPARRKLQPSTELSESGGVA